MNNHTEIEIRKDFNTIDANDTTVVAAKTVLEIGDLMKDGTIFAGISPDTNQKMYVEPFGASMTMSFNEAVEYAKKLQVGDKNDFRIPSKAELNVLFKNKDKGALKGSFNVTGSDVAGWYWSSSSTPHEKIKINAWMQRFSDGLQNYNLFRYFDGSVRCIR